MSTEVLKSLIETLGDLGIILEDSTPIDRNVRLVKNQLIYHDVMLRPASEKDSCMLSLDVKANMLSNEEHSEASLDEYFRLDKTIENLNDELSLLHISEKLARKENY